MGKVQEKFLDEFAKVFCKKAPNVAWNGGQIKNNMARFSKYLAERRENTHEKSERFELGDLTTDFKGHKIVIEFDSSGVAISNLLKYWPYLRGELSVEPKLPIVICHFSNWSSYGAYRDLWQWTLHQIQQDAQCRHQISGRLFDHWGNDHLLRSHSIAQAVGWVLDQLKSGN
jgi:hypothetical protein